MKTKELIILLLIGWTLAGCQKEINYQTAEEKLADKTWYLEKKSVGQQAFTYAAVSTFSFRLSKNLKKYSDSDGIEGTYNLTSLAGKASCGCYRLIAKRYATGHDDR